MRYIPISIVAFLLLAVGGFFVLNAYIYEEKQADAATNYKDATYLIDGERITLKDGVAEMEAAPGSASKVSVRYFGNEVRHDFDADGREDVAFLITMETGGTGLFYYVVAALNTERGYIGSQALYVGDRIAPQPTTMGTGNIIIVNYADRAPGESFAVQPSVGKSIWLLLDVEAMQFGEVAQNFEGEADPSKMTLGMKDWAWVSATYSDGTRIVPRAKDTFTLTFAKDGRFSATTDCNSIAGKYVATGTSIVFGDIISTLMYCEGSQEGVFTKLLGEAGNYHFTSRGELILDLKFDSGSAVFR